MTTFRIDEQKFIREITPLLTDGVTLSHVENKSRLGLELVTLSSDTRAVSLVLRFSMPVTAAKYRDYYGHEAHRLGMDVSS